MAGCPQVMWKPGRYIDAALCLRGAVTTPEDVRPLSGASDVGDGHVSEFPQASVIYLDAELALEVDSVGEVV